MDFSVDPLFKKTSADFDEGGARGLLLNNLSLDQNCKIIFDASDATVECDLEDTSNKQVIMSIENIQVEEPIITDDYSLSSDEDVSSDNEEAQNISDPIAEDLPDTTKEDQLDATKEDQPKTTQEDDPAISVEITKESSPSAQEQPLLEGGITKENSPVAQINEDSRVEIYRLKGRERYSTNEKDVLTICFIAKLPSFEDLPDFHIVPFLNGFDFFTDDANLAIPDLDNEDDEDDAMMDIVRELDVAPDAYQFDDYDVDYGMDDMDMDPFANTVDDQQYPENENTEPQDIEPESPKYPENDFLSALIYNGDQELLDYFDSTLVKNWAGPEHWKLRRSVDKKHATTTASNDAEQTEKIKRTITRKIVSDFLLPFRNVLEEEDAQEEKVFEQAIRKPALGRDTLIKMADNILPEDIHFSSKLLLQYSLKPAFPVSFIEYFVHDKY